VDIWKVDDKMFKVIFVLGRINEYVGTYDRVIEFISNLDNGKVLSVTKI
jgi:hypothetical protein